MSVLKSMFKPKLPAAAKTETIEVPKPVFVPQAQPTVRMPTSTDTDLLEAAQRTRASSRRRRGRLSTILTDQTKAVTASSGTKLGA